jgi:S-methylmethionine-dependent homocysteine/selenocysteine methylase
VSVGAYANGFVTAEEGHGEYRDLSPDEYFTDFVSPWIQTDRNGPASSRGPNSPAVPIVGGCCGIFPEHIARIRQGIDATAGRGGERK